MGSAIVGGLGAIQPVPIAQGGTGSATQNFVDLTQAQSVGGVKTFTSFPVTPSSDPTTSYQTANKQYVDTRVVGVGSSYYIKVSDVKANTTAGGTFTASAWQTRVINTEDNDSGGYCSIASNQITLAAGTYQCRIMCPARTVTNHKARLQNITDATTTILGTNGRSTNDISPITFSFIVGQFTIAAQKTFEVQHYCSATRATDGFGDAMSFGVSEVYTVAEFWKVG